MSSLSKSLVIGDIHLKPSNLETQKKLFNLLDSLIIPKRITDLIFLGDVYDTKAVIRSEAQNFFIQQLNNFVNKFSIKIHILVGNHDFENNNFNTHTLNPLSLLRFVYIYDRVTYKEDLNAIFIPYKHSKEEFLNDIKNCIEKNKDKINNSTIVYCHQGVAGFDLGSGILDVNGVNLKDLKTLNNLLYVIGHYHKPQIRIEDSIIYLGSPFSHSFGESNQNKKIAVIDNNQINYIGTTEFLPQHYKVTFDAEKLDFDKFNKYTLKDDDLIEITVKCKNNEIELYSKQFFEDKLSPLKLNIKIKYDVINNNINIRLNESYSHEQMLKKYLESKDRQDLFDMGLEYLKNAIL